MRTAMPPADEPRFQRYRIDGAPMGRCGLPGELGPTIVYLGSDAPSFTAAAEIVADAGCSLW